MVWPLKNSSSIVNEIRIIFPKGKFFALHIMVAAVKQLNDVELVIQESRCDTYILLVQASQAPVVLHEEYTEKGLGSFMWRKNYGHRESI